MCEQFNNLIAFGVFSNNNNNNKKKTEKRYK